MQLGSLQTAIDADAGEVGAAWSTSSTIAQSAQSRAVSSTALGATRVVCGEDVRARGAKKSNDALGVLVSEEERCRVRPEPSASHSPIANV